jgi:hypothetical protein
MKGNRHPGRPELRPRPRRGGIAATVLAVAFVALTAGSAPADVATFELRGVTLTKELVLPGTPVEIFDAFTGDVSGWWDHTFSGAPASLVIEPHVGGGFWERFDDAGNGVQHADVIAADRGKLLRLRGPFGFAGDALDLVHTFRFADAGEGRTRLSLTLNAAGQIDDDGVAALDGVWTHFLEGRFRPWVEAGRHRP